MGASAPAIPAGRCRRQTHATSIGLAADRLDPKRRSPYSQHEPIDHGGCAGAGQTTAPQPASARTTDDPTAFRSAGSRLTPDDTAGAQLAFGVCDGRSAASALSPCRRSAQWSTPLRARLPQWASAAELPILTDDALGSLPRTLMRGGKRPASIGVCACLGVGGASSASSQRRGSRPRPHRALGAFGRLSTIQWLSFIRRRLRVRRRCRFHHRGRERGPVQ